MTTTLQPLAAADLGRVHPIPADLGRVSSSAIIAAHLLVQRALELAGKRLLSRPLRGTYTGDLRDLHTHVEVTPDQLPRLLAGAFEWAPEAAALLGLHDEQLAAVLTAYVGDLLLAGAPYRIGQLRAALGTVGIAA